MEGKPLEGMKVAFLATDYFEQSELEEPKRALEGVGALVHILSPKSGQIQGVEHITKKDVFPVDNVLSEALPMDYDGVVLPGGALNADKLRIEPKAKEFVRAMEQEQKPIGVICHGSWLLVSAGLVQGKTMTSYPTIMDDILNAGGSWTDKEVVRENNWVSSRQPSDLPYFNAELINLLTEYKNGTLESGTRHGL